MGKQTASSTKLFSKSKAIVSQGVINVNKIVGKCPEVCMKVNNIPLMFLIDSGSQVTTITEKCYDKFSGKNMICQIVVV